MSIYKDEISKGALISAIILGCIIVPLTYIVLYIAKPDLFKSKSYLWLSIIVLVIQLSILAVVYPSVHSADIKNKESSVKQNVHLIDDALNDYLLENDTLPPELSDLVESGHLKELPLNPFTNEVMIEIDFGQDNFEGNITYIPIVLDDKQQFYLIIGYGYRGHDGYDLNKDGKSDHVIIFVTNCDDDFKEVDMLETIFE